MPAWLRPQDESLWARAKELALKTYKEGSESYWPVVTAIFKRLGGTPGKDDTAKAHDELERGVQAVEALGADERAGLEAVAESIVRAGQVGQVHNPEGHNQWTAAGGSGEEPEKSQGHHAWFKDSYSGVMHELYKDKHGNLYRAPHHNVIDLDTKNRIGRWEAPPHMAEKMAGMILQGKGKEWSDTVQAGAPVGNRNATDAVKAHWSDQARQAALEARRQHPEDPYGYWNEGEIGRGLAKKFAKEVAGKLKAQGLHQKFLGAGHELQRSVMEHSETYEKAPDRLIENWNPDHDFHGFMAHAVHHELSHMKASEASSDSTVKASDGTVLDFGSLARAAAAVQVAHWAADTVTNAHEALGKLYEDVAGLADTLAEAYAGRTGLLPESADPGAVVAGVLDVVEKARASVPEGAEDLRNILAEMEQAANKAKYLLKAMNETKADTVKAAGTSEGAKKGWQRRGKIGQSEAFELFHKHVGAGSSGEMADKLSEIENPTHEHVHSIVSKEWGPNITSEIMDTFHKHMTAGETKASNQSMSEENVIQCRAAVGTQLEVTKAWTPNEPVRFIYAPSGQHTITAGFRKSDTITICVVVDDATPKVLQESFDHLTATMPEQEPYADEDHEGRKATLRFPAAETRFEWGQIKGDTGVIVSGGQPTSYGAEVVNGKVYRSYSPEFASDADYGKASRTEDGHWTFPDGVRGSEGNPARLVGVNFVVGALTNRPAFRAMPAVKAKHAVVAAQDGVVKAVEDTATRSEAAKKGWEGRLRQYVGDNLKHHVSMVSPGKTGMHYDEQHLVRNLTLGNASFHPHGEKARIRLGVSHYGGWKSFSNDDIAEARTRLDTPITEDEKEHVVRQLMRLPEEHKRNIIDPRGNRFTDNPRSSYNQDDPALAYDATPSSTVQAAWSDAARRAAAEARHRNVDTDLAGVANQLSFNADEQTKKTLDTEPPHGLYSHEQARHQHLKALEAHTKAWASSKNGTAEQEHHYSKMKEHKARAEGHYKAMAWLGRVEATDATPLDGIVARSESVVEDLAARRSAAEAVLDEVVPKPPPVPERGPARSAEDVLDDLRAAETARASGKDAATALVESIVKAKNFQPVG